MTLKHLFLKLFILLIAFQSNAQNDSLNYNWESVTIGGGGYITGMKIHPLDSNIIYMRTDVGGAYRWNSDLEKMEQIINLREGNYYGVAGIAIHPTNKDIIYLAVDRKNVAEKSAILKSTNRGDSWEVIPTPSGVKFGANGGRNNSNTDDRDREGSPIAITPNNINELWVGSREKGLWKLTGTSWQRIAQNTMPDNDLENSIRNVFFHPQNSNYIFVGYYNYGVYRSSNGGSSFASINGGNNDLKDVSDLSISTDGTQLFAACRNNGIYRLNTPLTNTNWTNTNIPDENQGYGYLTVTTSPHDNDIVVASPAGTSGNNFERLYVSYDSGANWIKKDDVTISSIYTWQQNDANGQHPSQITFDPINPDRLYYTCWSGLWHTPNWQSNQVDWTNTMNLGHEEIINCGLAEFPPNNDGNVLGVNSGDHTGWVISDPTDFPEEDIKDLTSPSGGFIKGAGFAICDQHPQNMAISSTNRWTDSDGYLLYSTDAGASFTKADGYQTSWGKANIAFAKGDPDNIVVACSDGIKYSTDHGATFNSASGISGIEVANAVFYSQRILASDFVVNNRFYVYKRTDGTVYRSTNSGQNWNYRGTVPFTLSNEGNSTRLRATPGKAGHLWINHHNHGLHRSTDGGSTWTKINTVSKAIATAIGKEKEVDGYPTIYMFGQLTGEPEPWFYRSTTEGASWERISDEQDFFLGARIKHLVADRNEFGKVYVGTAGMGVWSGSETESEPEPEPLFIEVITPTQGESIETGSAYDIQWEDNVLGDVRIVLYKNGSYDRTLAPSVPSNGTYSWLLDNTISPGEEYQIRVRSNQNLDVDDYSDYFSVIEESVEPFCNLIPNGTFDNGDLSGWNFLNFAGASGTYSSPWNRAQLSIENPGTAFWQLRLEHEDIYLEGGRTYQLRYEAKAWGDREMSVRIVRRDNNDKLYDEVIPLENAWNPRPVVTFTMPLNGYIGILFRVGSNDHTVILDNITLDEMGCNNQINLIDNKMSQIYSKKEFNLEKNQLDTPSLLLFPNPSVDVINSTFELDKNTAVSFTIVNTLGREVKRIEQKYLDAGSQKLSEDISDLSNGIYFYRLKTKDWEVVKRFVISR